MKWNTAKNSFCLFLTAFIWGMSFVAQSKGMEYMKPFTFNGARCLIGAFVLFLFLLAPGKTSREKRRKIEWKKNLRAGIWCGLVLAGASMFQQIGIQDISVGKAGFITTLYIIFVPIAGIFFHKKVMPPVWIAAGMAAVGMYLLCVEESFTIEKGDILVFIGALFFTAHILVIDYYAQTTDGVTVSCIQFAVCGVLCTAGAFLWEQPAAGQLFSGMGTLLYSGVLSCGVAYTLQIVGQKGLSPTVAALILSLESVVAAVAGWAAYKIGFLTEDQSLSGPQIAGCLIVFFAVVLVQLPADWFPFAHGPGRSRKSME